MNFNLYGTQDAKAVHDDPDAYDGAEAHHKRDFDGLEDKIDGRDVFYSTQYDQISTLEGHDLMKKRDVDFSDFEAIQYMLQLEATKEEVIRDRKKKEREDLKIYGEKYGLFTADSPDLDKHLSDKQTKEYIKQRRLEEIQIDHSYCCCEICEGKRDKNESNIKHVDKGFLKNVNVKNRYICTGIEPDMLGKVIRKEMVQNQALLPEDIIYHFKKRKTLVELFSKDDAQKLGYESLFQEDAKDSTRMVRHERLEMLSDQKVETVSIEYYKHKAKTFLLQKSSIRKADHSVDSVIRLYEYTLPQLDGKPDDAGTSMVEPKFLTKEKRWLSRQSSVIDGKGRNDRPRRSLSASFKKSKSQEVEMVNTAASDIKGGVKHATPFNAQLLREASLLQADEGIKIETFTMAYNQTTIKYGQWLFYYTIKKGKNEEIVDLMQLDLEHPTMAAKTIQTTKLRATKMNVIAKPMELTKEQKEQGEELPKFEEISVFGTVGILFSIDSKFIGDSKCNLDISEKQAYQWIQKQHVLHLAYGEEDLLITSVRTCGTLSNSIVAVQSPYQKTENNATLGYHPQVLTTEDDGPSQKSYKDDYFTISVNSLDFVFKILDDEEEDHQEQQDIEQLIDRAEKHKMNRRTTLFMKKGFSELIDDKSLGHGHGVNINKILKQRSSFWKNADIETREGRRQTITHIKQDIEKMQSLHHRLNKEDCEDGEKIEDSEKSSRDDGDDPENFEQSIASDEEEKAKETKVEQITFSEDGVSPKFKALIEKVRCTQYSTYQIRCNQERNYVYKSDGTQNNAVSTALSQMQELSSKILGHNLLLVQSNERSQQIYYFQTLELLDGNYFMKIYISEAKQNIKYRVIEEYDRLHLSPLVRGLADSGLQEVQQLHPYFGNVFVDSDKYFIKDDQLKKLNIQSRDLNILIHNKKHFFHFFDTQPQKNSKTIRPYYDSYRHVQVRLQKYDQYMRGQQQLVIEIWHNEEVKVNQNEGLFKNLRPRYEYKEGEVLHAELVQSTFLDKDTVENFSNICPSSAVMKVQPQSDEYKALTKTYSGENCSLFKQRYQILTLQDVKHDPLLGIDKDLIYCIYEYELTWNETHPTKESTRFRLVGRKQLVFNDEEIDRYAILAPYYPDHTNYIIQGTQLLKGHGDNTIVLENFNEVDFQFRTGIVNSGYKIYMDTNDDTDWKCILVESQINTHDLPRGEKGDAVTAGDRQEARNALSNHDIKRMFQYQFNVIINMVPFEPLESQTLLDDTLDNNQHDYFAPLEVLHGNSILDYILFHPQSVEQYDVTDYYPSLIQKFISNQNQIRPNTENKNQYREALDLAFGQSLSWYRRPGEVWLDLLQMNPLYRCYDQDDKNIAVTSITGAFLTKRILSQNMTVQNYEIVLQVLPIIIDTKHIDITEYAEFFIDCADHNNFGIRLTEGVDGKNLPKFSYEEYEIKDLDFDGNTADLDLRKYAARYLIDLDQEDDELHREEQEEEAVRAARSYSERKALPNREKKKLLVHKDLTDSEREIDLKEELDVVEIEEKQIIKKHNHPREGVKDVRVKYFLINLDSMAYISKMRYIQGVNDHVIEVTEQVLSELMLKINDKFFDYFDQAPIIRNLLDFKFKETKKFVLRQFIMYFLLYIVPYMVQLFWHHEKPLLVEICIIICCVTQAYFAILMYTVMMAIGIREYLKDLFNLNQFLISCFFPVYAFFRFFSTKNLLPTDDGDLDGMYGFFLFSNCFIILNMAFKVFSLMKVDPKFGLLVQLVSTALSDCVNFTVFMFIWISMFAVIQRILGVDGKYVGRKYSDINGAVAFFLETFEDGVGNIKRPRYHIWQNKYHCDKTDIGCTEANRWVSIIAIYVIWLTWFLNQFVVFIILVNFLIVYIGNSFQNVMDSALKFKYQQICQQIKEHMIIKQRFAGKQITLPFVLVANVQEEEDDPSFGGLVSQVIDNVKKTNRGLKRNMEEERDTLKKTIESRHKHFDFLVEEADKHISQEIKDTSERLDTGIQNLKDDVKAVRESLEASITDQKVHVTQDFTGMWSEMDALFKQLSDTLRDDMETYRQEFGEVASQVETFGSDFQKGFQTVQQGVNSQIGTVKQSVGAINDNVGKVNQGVLDVKGGVKDAEETAIKGIADVNDTVGNAGKALTSVKTGFLKQVESVESNINKVKGSVDSVSQDVASTTADVNAKAAAAADKAAAKEAEMQQMLKAEEEEKESGGKKKKKGKK